MPIQAMGRDFADIWNVPGSARALALSATSLRVLRLSGFRERVNHAEAEAPLDAVVVHHMDRESRAGHMIRYLVVDFPDGRWMADSQIIMKKNGQTAPFAQSSDALIAALGPRAVAIS